MQTAAGKGGSDRSVVIADSYHIFYCMAGNRQRENLTNLRPIKSLLLLWGNRESGFSAASEILSDGRRRTAIVKRLNIASSGPMLIATIRVLDRGISGR